MDIFERSLIEKTAIENGWENVLQSTSEIILLGSSRHKAQAGISPGRDLAKWVVELPDGLHHREIVRSLPYLPNKGCSFCVNDYVQLTQLLHRSAELATSLPNQAAVIFAQKVDKELAGISSFNSEIERVVKQRVGQDTFRQALLDYWGGACAVTGIRVPEILRASHAKPWADCSNDAERLNVFNGFPLTANLDALFDRGLITFDEKGSLICSSLLDVEQRLALQLAGELKLRWIAPNHTPFLLWHRSKVFRI